jgi:hypothetical protein
MLTISNPLLRHCTLLCKPARTLITHAHVDLPAGFRRLREPRAVFLDDCCDTIVFDSTRPSLRTMATEQSSTEPLRPESHPMTQPERPATAHTTGGASTLQVPGIQVDGASDDDERQPRTAAAPALSTQPSRAASPNPHAIYPHTQVTYDDPDFRKPPPLEYSLRTRRKAIFWFWLLIFVDCILMPIGMYFGMWYGLTRDQLSANAVFSISTALLGTVSIVEYFVRFIRLWRKNSNCRVIGAQRYYVCIPAGIARALADYG